MPNRPKVRTPEQVLRTALENIAACYRMRNGRHKKEYNAKLVTSLDTANKDRAKAFADYERATKGKVNP